MAKSKVSGKLTQKLLGIKSENESIGLYVCSSRDIATWKWRPVKRDESAVWLYTCTRWCVPFLPGYDSCQDSARLWFHFICGPGFFSGLNPHGPTGKGKYAPYRRATVTVKERFPLSSFVQSPRAELHKTNHSTTISPDA